MHCSTLFHQLMLDIWNDYVFSGIRQRLQKSAMMLIKNERGGFSFDSQLVIGVRQSYGMFISDFLEPSRNSSISFLSFMIKCSCFFF